MKRKGNPEKSERRLNLLMAVSFQCDFVTLSRCSHLFDLGSFMWQIIGFGHLLRQRRQEIIGPSITNDKWKPVDTVCRWIMCFASHSDQELSSLYCHIQEARSEHFQSNGLQKIGRENNRKTLTIILLMIKLEPSNLVLCLK